MDQSAEKAEAVTCLLCGRRATLKTMHRLSGADWLRTATLEKLGLLEGGERTENDSLPARPYLCFSHYSRSDILIDESGSRQIRHGALPTKKSYDGKTSQGPRLSVKERMSKRSTTSRTVASSASDPPPKKRSVSADTDGPPPLPQYSPEPRPTLHIRSYILIRYLPPLEGGKLFDITHKHCLTGNKAEGGIVQLRRGNGSSRQAVFLREFTDRSEAAREMLRQMGGVQQKSPPQPSEASTTSTDLNDLPVAMMRMLDELAQIKSMLASVTANQTLLVQHLLQPPAPSAAPALDVEGLVAPGPTSGTRRKLSGMPRLTTMVEEGVNDDGLGADAVAGGEKVRDEEESEQMATLQPMVKLESVQADPETLVGVKTEPSEVDDDDPPQMDLCL